MNKIIFILVFSSLNVLGYFIITLEKKIPSIAEPSFNVNHLSQTRENGAKDASSLVKLKEQSFRDNDAFVPVDKKRRPSSQSGLSEDKKKFDLDRQSLKHSLKMSEEELNSLSDAMQRILDKSSEAMQE